MIASEKQITADERKQKIRDRYKGVDPTELEVIPVIATDEVRLEERQLRVAAYVRVSTEMMSRYRLLNCNVTSSPSGSRPTPDGSSPGSILMKVFPVRRCPTVKACSR